MRLANDRLIGFGPLALALAAVAGAGCGNYSNGVLDDAPFYNALPRAQDLQVDVPKSAAQPACVLGESKIATDTRALGLGLALGVYNILGVIDLIRNLPPTARTADTRLWGPFPDGQHQGFWVQVRMVRVPASGAPSFTVEVQERLGLVGDFATLLSAELTGAVAQRGSGTLHYDYAAARKLGVGKSDDPAAGQLNIAYDLASDPRTIGLRTVGTPTESSIDISSYADGQAQLVLAFVDDKGAKFNATSKFAKGGQGKATYSVKSGPIADVVDECWDATYCRSYLNDRAGWWLSPPCTTTSCELGNIASCPAGLH